MPAGTPKEINMATENLSSFEEQIIEHARMLPDSEKVKLAEVMEFMSEIPDSHKLLRKARIQGRCESWSEALTFMKKENARIVEGGAS